MKAKKQTAQDLIDEVSKEQEDDREQYKTFHTLNYRNYNSTRDKIIEFITLYYGMDSFVATRIYDIFEEAKK